VLLSACLGLQAPVVQARNTDGFDDSWAYTAQSRMDDAERFKDCEELMVSCVRCNKTSPFCGVFRDGCSTGLVCGNSECNALYFGRQSARDCYYYLSSRITLLVRKCLHRYYECWLVCDDPACGKRSMQQFLAGLACVEDCHGRMVQEYDEAMLHNQLKKIESLVNYQKQNIKRQGDPELARLVNACYLFFRTFCSLRSTILAVRRIYLRNISKCTECYLNI
jgi:DNA polymerase alpha subunit A